MASGPENPRKLSSKQIIDLAAVIDAEQMESIAEGYLGIEHETIKNLKYENKHNAEAFNRSVIRHWMYANDPADQIQVSLFYLPFRLNGYRVCKYCLHFGCFQDLHTL